MLHVCIVLKICIATCLCVSRPACMCVCVSYNECDWGVEKLTFMTFILEKGQKSYLLPKNELDFLDLRPPSQFPYRLNVLYIHYITFYNVEKFHVENTFCPQFCLLWHWKWAQPEIRKVKSTHKKCSAKRSTFFSGGLKAKAAEAPQTDRDQIFSLFYPPPPPWKKRKMKLGATWCWSGYWSTNLKFNSGGEETTKIWSFLRLKSFHDFWKAYTSWVNWIANLSIPWLPSGPTPPIIRRQVVQFGMFGAASSEGDVFILSTSSRIDIFTNSQKNYLLKRLSSKPLRKRAQHLPLDPSFRFCFGGIKLTSYYLNFWENLTNWKLNGTQFKEFKLDYRTSCFWPYWIKVVFCSCNVGEK